MSPPLAQLEITQQAPHLHTSPPPFTQLEITQQARRGVQQRRAAEEAALLADNHAHLEAERVAAAARAEALKVQAAQTRAENEARIRARKEAVQLQRQADNELMKSNIR